MAQWQTSLAVTWETCPGERHSRKVSHQLGKCVPAKLRPLCRDDQRLKKPLFITEPCSFAAAAISFCMLRCWKEAEKQWIIYPSPSMYAQLQLLWGPHAEYWLWVLLAYQQLNQFCILENEHVVWSLFIFYEGLPAPIREGFVAITHSVLMFLSIAASLDPDQLWNEVFLFLLFLGYLRI